MADCVEHPQAALRERPPGHSDRFFSLYNLTLSIRDTFKQYFNKFVPSLRDKFKLWGILSANLDEVVDLHRAVLARHPPGHSNRYLHLGNLAWSLQERFEQQGVLSDLDEAIDLFRAALALCPSGHSDLSSSLNNLATSLCDRFKWKGVLPDLDEAIDLRRSALALCPPGHSDRPLSLNNLATSLHDRFEQQGVLSDLDEATELHQAALALCPLGHSHRFFSLNNLAMSFQAKFEQQGTLSDLDEAIDLHQAALTLCPPGHPKQPFFLNNLALSLHTRFKQKGVLADLDEAIDLLRDALALCPPSQSNQCGSLNNLASSLSARFGHWGILSDLDEAIDLHRAALALYPPGHFGQPSFLNNLASNLQERFRQQSVLSDLNEAIDLHRTALSLCPPGHFKQVPSLGKLATSLRNRFKQLGIMSDLDEAINLHRAALTLCPSHHSDRSSSLHNIAASLSERFDHWGVLSDLDEAIDLHRAALVLSPPGHFGRSSSLGNLASSLQDRFKEYGVLADLDEAIGLHQAALAHCSPDNSSQSLCLSQLASSLHNRFEQQGILSDLNEAINLHRAALALCPPHHSNRHSYLSNLAWSLQERFKQQGTLSALDEAIDLYQTALALHPPGHSERCLSLNNLATSLCDRFRQLGVISDLDEAFKLYAQLLEASHAVSHSDLYAAKAWTTSAEEFMHGSALAAYQTTLKFLDDWQHMGGLSSPHHFDLVRKTTSSLAMDAFSCSVRHGTFMTAVELVEQGRAVFWTQLSHFQTPLNEISASGPSGEALAEELKQLSFQLRNALDVSTSSTSEDQFSRIRKLTVQRDDVISRIRVLPGFSRFLLPPLFSDLQKAAKDGPVIIVNASRYSCDALIILNAQNPVHIPLDITKAEASELSIKFQFLTGNAGSSDDRLEVHELVGVLRKLWEHVVSPIVKALRQFTCPGSRIWWCPTAEFAVLPLHAAGPYEKKSHNLSHFYVSSYTPTLAALVRARRQASRDASTPQFVAIGQGTPNRGKELPRVAAELDVVAKRVAPVLSFTSLADSDATVQRALDAINQHQWLHLACHGTPKRKKPFESSFAMYDGPLTITDIIRPSSQRPHLQTPEFAFLSACHTTVGHASSPDEAIHLAAAMQFSGFRSVIGSMWSVDDNVAGELVSAFYDNLVDGSGRLECTRAAIALHKAVKKLRSRLPFEQQIVFIHIGV